MERDSLKLSFLLQKKTQALVEGAGGGEAGGRGQEPRRRGDGKCMGSRERVGGKQYHYLRWWGTWKMGKLCNIA